MRGAGEVRHTVVATGCPLGAPVFEEQPSPQATWPSGPRPGKGILRFPNPLMYLAPTYAGSAQGTKETNK